MLPPVLHFVFQASPRHSGPERNSTPSKSKQITGLKGTFNPEEGVFKVSAPRSDVRVDVDAWQLPPFHGADLLGGIYSRKRRRGDVMGDLVLFQDEVNPVMSAALENGLSVTPSTTIFSSTSRKSISCTSGVREPWKTSQRRPQSSDRVKEIRAASAQPDSHFGGPVIPTASSIPLLSRRHSWFHRPKQQRHVQSRLGPKREDAVRLRVREGNGRQHLGAFAAATTTRVVDGDFAVHEDELQTVLKTLRQARFDHIVGIIITMRARRLRTLFLHYLGKKESDASQPSAAGKGIEPVCHRSSFHFTSPAERGRSIHRDFPFPHMWKGKECERLAGHVMVRWPQMLMLACATFLARFQFVFVNAKSAINYRVVVAGRQTRPGVDAHFLPDLEAARIFAFQAKTALNMPLFAFGPVKPRMPSMT